jgi:hypothetical protein
MRIQAMTKSQNETSETTTPKLATDYKEAILSEKVDQPTSCTSSVEVTSFPLPNTVFASSSEEHRQVTIDPGQVKRSLESLKRNRHLQKKGLG